jgi:hypothetical protein
MDGSAITSGPLLDKIFARVALDKEEGDVAYFYALILQIEYITKLVTAGILACIADDPDRQRYGIEYRLVRANSIGDWVAVLNTVLSGPAAQFFFTEARPLVRELTERVGPANWRHAAVDNLSQAVQELGIDIRIGSKVALRQFFEITAALRNRTRGHGATTVSQCGVPCPLIAIAVDRLATELQLFKIPWVYLHRNMSGKYRVLPLLGDSSQLDYLKKTRDVKLPNGVYLYLDRPIRVSMVFSDPDLLDVFLPNGNFRENSFEILSYVTNDCRTCDGAAWTDPPGRLPSSETEGRTTLEIVGKTFSNLPSELRGYIQRPRLESALIEELEKTDRHPIISLTGPGGIGKTSLAITALHRLTKHDNPPYDVVLWMSARDIDLLEAGPKPVLSRVPTRKEIARCAVDLLEPPERKSAGFDPETYFSECLTGCAVGRTLFVIDNFETLEDPSGVFKWIDTYIRPPNKVLITTRFRDFSGDFPIEVAGMTDEEALALIDREATRLQINHLIDGPYKEDLIRESDGHPYVIKILMGQVAKERRPVKPERIVAGANQLLTALFERTYSNLSPASQRVFLLLCSWRVLVPTIAVEAIMLRPGNERFDVMGALEELRRFSLVEETTSPADTMTFVGVPLAASIFGKRKLEVSALKAAIEEDRQLLMECGAGKRDDVPRGVFPRVERLLRAVALKASTDVGALRTNLPILEHIALNVPQAYINLADLVLETEQTQESVERAKGYLRNFLERSHDLSQKKSVWFKLANLCVGTGDAVGEVHAISEVALLPTADAEEISEIANRLNSRIRELKGQDIGEAWSPEVRVLLERVISAMEKHMSKLSATGCSRLAWLLLNVGKGEKAKDVAQKGLERDPDNEYCRKLLQRLDSWLE